MSGRRPNIISSSSSGPSSSHSPSYEFIDVDDDIESAVPSHSSFATSNRSTLSRQSSLNNRLPPTTNTLSSSSSSSSSSSLSSPGIEGVKNHIISLSDSLGVFFDDFKTKNWSSLDRQILSESLKQLSDTAHRIHEFIPGFLSYNSSSSSLSSSSTNSKRVRSPNNYDAMQEDSDALDALMSDNSLSSFSSGKNEYRGNDAMEEDADLALARRLQAEEEQSHAERRRTVVNEEADESMKLLLLQSTCQCCKKVIHDGTIAELSCNHFLCQSCIAAHLRRSLSAAAADNNSGGSKNRSGHIGKGMPIDLYCCADSSCKTMIPARIYRYVLTDGESSLIADLSAQPAMNASNIVTCPKCKFAFEAVSGSISSEQSSNKVVAQAMAEMGLDGRPLSPAALQHRSQYRFRCNDCSTIFCSGCQTIPYHSGFNCDEYRAYLHAARCRFCSAQLPPRAASFFSSLVGGGISDVCDDKECIDKKADCCDKILSCRHPCNGIKGEKSCYGCLHKDCVNFLLPPPPSSKGIVLSSAALKSSADFKGDDYCSVCYSESISGAPCIRLSSCGHSFHYRCIVARTEKRWPGARITFGFLCCVLCREEIEHISLNKLLEPLLKLKVSVQEKAEQRLTFEGLNNDKELTTVGSRYYQKPRDYAMDRFAYYPCFKCKNPFFGGRRACEEVKDQSEEKFKADDLICGGCTAGNDSKSCAKHGKEYIEFKCKFCCNIAAWFCWGNTHFCADCHRKQEQGDYLTRKQISELPKCGGKGKCPLGVIHPPNGNEHALGCGICRPRDF